MFVVHPVSQTLQRTGHGTVTVGGPGNGEPVDLVPQFKVRVPTDTADAVVAGSTDRECPVQSPDRGAVHGRPGLINQANYELPSLPRSERGTP